MKSTVKILFLGLAAALGCRGADAPPRELSGSGSTFVYPLMVQWASQYEKVEDGCKVRYRATGSGNGIKAILARQADFACTDAPLTDEQVAKAREDGNELLHVPLVLGAVVPAYNLPGLKETLRFTGPVLADIYLGKITKWDDETLQDLNPGVKLPAKKIEVVHRRDGSGTTYIWADYLAKVSKEWKKKVGVGTEVKWPVGEAEVGNDGVAEHVRQTPGSIGYVELSYAFKQDLPFGMVRNRAGEFVKGSLPAVRTAAANALSDIPEDLRYSLTDAPGKGSYPICGTTWALVPVKPSAGKGKLLVDFLRWGTGEGQQRVEDLFYVRLPDGLVDRAVKMIDQIKAGK
jgi:phosphate transport system substrate-binding protein